MKIVNWHGVIYRLSDRNYLKLLRQIANDQPAAIDTLGKQIAVIHETLTDMRADEAQSLLDWENEQGRRRTRDRAIDKVLGGSQK